MSQDTIPGGLQASRQPGIWLYRSPEATGLSRLGGLPNLPAAKAWPRRDDTGLPMHFIGQIDLADMPRTPLAPGLPALPPSGLLLFFADIDEEMLWNDDPRSCTRVIYAPVAGSEHPAPDSLPLWGHEFGKHDGGYARDAAIMPRHGLKAAVLDTFTLYPLNFGRGDALVQEADRITAANVEHVLGAPLPKLDYCAHPRAPAAWACSGDNESLSLRRHFLLGAPVAVQNSAGGAVADGHVALMQFDTDWGVDDRFMFCDCGMAQFWITPQDLAGGHFENAWATTEGG
jgi:hypothetical protein